MRYLLACILLFSAQAMADPYQASRCTIDYIAMGQVVPLSMSKIGIGQHATIQVTTNRDRSYQVILNPMNHDHPHGRTTLSHEVIATVSQGPNAGTREQAYHNDKVTILLARAGTNIIDVDASLTSTAGPLLAGKYTLNYNVICIPSH